MRKSGDDRPRASRAPSTARKDTGRSKLRPPAVRKSDKPGVLEVLKEKARKRPLVVADADSLLAHQDPPKHVRPADMSSLPDVALSNEDAFPSFAHHPSTPPPLAAPPPASLVRKARTRRREQEDTPAIDPREVARLAAFAGKGRKSRFSVASRVSHLSVQGVPVIGMRNRFDTLLVVVGQYKAQVLLMAVVLTVALPLALNSANYNTPELGVRPNIVLFFPDDNGYNDVNYTNPTISKPFRTPNIDALAMSGVRLASHYTASTCTPARCSVMTGRYLTRTGCYEDFGVGQARALPLSERTVAEYLKGEGYYTAAFGKWHLGSYHSSYLPTSRGFDHFVGFLGGGGDFFLHTDGGGYDWWYDDAVDTTVYGDYSTYVLNASIEFFLFHTAVHHEPWFMYVPTKVPHGGYSAPLEAMELYASDYINNNNNNNGNGNNNGNNNGNGDNDMGGGNDIAAWVAEIGLLDGLVGSVVGYLRQTEMYGRTVIIYAGDHGSNSDDPSYDGSYGRTYPFQGGKGSNLEGGVRTPAFVHSPLLPHSMRGREITAVVSVYDWLPTICGMAGVSVDSSQAPDGWDLTGLLFRGDSTSDFRWREVLIALERCSWSDNGNGNDNDKQDEDMEGGNKDIASAIRYGQYKLQAGCIYDDGTPAWYALYNVVDDPTESTDLASSSAYADVVSHMLGRLAYFSRSARNPNEEECSNCAEGCTVNGYWGPYYDDDWTYLC